MIGFGICYFEKEIIVNLNVILIVQFVVFFIFVGFMMKFVWLLLIKVFDECVKKIVDGLVVVDCGKVDLVVVEKCIQGELVLVCDEGQKCIGEVEKCVQLIIEEVKKMVVEEVVCIIVNVKVDV